MVPKYEAVSVFRVGSRFNVVYLNLDVRVCPLSDVMKLNL